MTPDEQAPVAAPPPPASTKGLAKRTRQGISWTAAGAVGQNVVRLGVYAALGRILSHTEFGVVAAVMTVIQLGNTLKDLGLGLALVQRKVLEPEHIEAAFTFSVLLGSVLTVGMFLCAGLFARFYGIEDSVWIIRLMSLLFFLRGVALVPAFMCRRNMAFRALTIIDVVAYFMGSTTSVVLAVLGFGAWAVAWGYVVETTLNVGMVIYLEPPPRGLRLRKRHLRELLGFGLGQSAANLANYFALNGDYMVVGHFLGPAKLGIYQRAYELMRFPAAIFTSVASQVLFSAFARVQDDPERLGRAFRRTLFASALVLLPASAGLIVLAPELVRIVLGDNWSSVEWPFRIMATSMLFRTTYKLSSLVGKSSGDTFTLAIWQVVYAACVIGGALVAMRWDILGVSVTTAVSVFLQFFALGQMGLKATDLRWRDLAAAHVQPLIYAAVVGGVAYVIATALRAAGQGFVVVAAATTTAGTLVFFVLARFGMRRGTGDWPWLRDTLAPLVTRKRRKAKPVA